jgi:ferredoxin
MAKYERRTEFDAALAVVGIPLGGLNYASNSEEHRMTSSDDEGVTVTISRRAYDRLSAARKAGESVSDVVIRLVSSTLEGLQRRGEKVIVTSDGIKIGVKIEQDLCLGAMSCVALAPEVFAFDDTQKGRWRKANQPLGMHDVEKGQIGSERLKLAAQSCPYRAIRLKDVDSGEELPV